MRRCSIVTCPVSFTPRRSLNLSSPNPRAVWSTTWRLKAPIFSELHIWCLMFAMGFGMCLTVFLLKRPHPRVYSQIFNLELLTEWKYHSIAFTDSTHFDKTFMQKITTLYPRFYIIILFFWSKLNILLILGWKYYCKYS